MDDFLKTLLIAIIPAVLTSIITYLTATKKTKSSMNELKESNKHEINRLMEQHKLDIESIEKKHMLELESKNREHEHRLELMQKEHENELVRNEKFSESKVKYNTAEKLMENPQEALSVLNNLMQLKELAEKYKEGK